MTEQEKLIHARNTFDTMCGAFDNKKWPYKKDEEKLIVECEGQGEDLPMKFTITVDPLRQLVILISYIPFDVPEDKSLEMAVAICSINKRLVNGCFEYDFLNGRLYFRMSNSFIESILGESVFEYLIICAMGTVDDFNDKLMMIAKGALSLEQFLQSLSD